MELFRAWTDGWNGVTMVIALVVLLSIVQGMIRGASSSAKRLGQMIIDGILTVIGLLAGWRIAAWLSPLLQNWLIGLEIAIPAENLNFWQQLYYTLTTSIRDFQLLRYGILFIAAYWMIRGLLFAFIVPLFMVRLAGHDHEEAWMKRRESSSWASAGSSALGGLFGGLVGVGRAFLVIALLFAVTTLAPQSNAAGYIQASSLYRMGAVKVIEPAAGDLIAEQLPVFTRAVEEEFSSILQRKYEVLDAHIPEDIALAAKEVAAKGVSDEEKAFLLYEWVGSRVQYDWEKVRLYEEERIWKEQTPEDTFASRKGVCIDYSRLYAVMARSVGLDVKVVTGLGYDGQGGFGPHAWNEVYLSDDRRWAPLDSTWVSSGGNWFDPPNFNETHIKEA